MSYDDYNTRIDGDANKDSVKAVAFQPSECEAALRLTMQYTESTYPSKKMNFMSQSQYQPSTASGGETGKVLFTDSQWQEFESQKMIYRHMMASFPVLPQSTNRSGTDLRLSSGSDPEPWRCKRTDGKKWRCSRDVMPGQKHCERHAHKNKHRSRKLVETQTHKTKVHNYHSVLLPSSSMPTSCQQPRYTEWFMESGTIPTSSSNQKIQQPMYSPSVGSKRDHFCQQLLEGNHQDYLEGVWSRNGGDNCSLSLSMQPGGNRTCDNQDFFQMGTGTLNGDREGNADGSNSRNQWVNQGSWFGGPLGEALCAGLASTPKESLNVSSPTDHGLH